MNTPRKCPNHADNIPCPIKMAQEAAEIVSQAKGPDAARKTAGEALRLIMAYSEPPRTSSGFVPLSESTEGKIPF